MKNITRPVVITADEYAASAKNNGSTRPLIGNANTFNTINNNIGIVNVSIVAAALLANISIAMKPTAVRLVATSISIELVIRPIRFTPIFIAGLVRATVPSCPDIVVCEYVIHILVKPNRYIINIIPNIITA